MAPGPFVPALGSLPSGAETPGREHSCSTPTPRCLPPWAQGPHPAASTPHSPGARPAAAPAKALAPPWGICSRSRAKGGRAGCGVLRAASPPHVPSHPIPLRWASCEHRAAAAGRGGGRGKDARSPGTPGPLRLPCSRMAEQRAHGLKFQLVLILSVTPQQGHPQTSQVPSVLSTPARPRGHFPSQHTGTASPPVLPTGTRSQGAPQPPATLLPGSASPRLSPTAIPGCSGIERLPASTRREKSGYKKGQGWGCLPAALGLFSQRLLLLLLAPPGHSPAPRPTAEGSHRLALGARDLQPPQ